MACWGPRRDTRVMSASPAATVEQVLGRRRDDACFILVRHRPPLVSEVTADAAAFDELYARTLRTTMLLSYLGMPGVSVPRGAGRTRGLGLLVSGLPGDDERVLLAAQAVDDVVPGSVSTPGRGHVAASTPWAVQDANDSGPNLPTAMNTASTT